MSRQRTTRRGALAKVHIAKKSLGLSDEEYRNLLEAKFGAGSAKGLSLSQLQQLADHFQALGWEPAPPRRSGRKPKNMDTRRGPLLSKIEAYLAEAGRPWEYADAIAKRVCKVDKVSWCKAEQLQKVVAALAYNAKREGRRV